VATIHLLAGPAAQAVAPLVPASFMADLADGLVLGALDGDRPVGVALARPVEGDVLYVGVDPAYQRRGIGLALATALEIHLPHGPLRTFYEAGSPSTEALLARAGWSPGEPSMLHVVSSPAAVAPAAWMKARSLGAGFEIFPWTELQDPELEALRTQLWIPEDLHPDVQPPGWDPVTSVGLRLHGEVVGWVINHMLGPDVLAFTCSYVRPDLQRLGRVFALYRVAVARMAEAGIPTAVWHVPLRHPGMASFARRWMVPYAHASTTIMRATKAL
jgi:ribosomal protein S18 acetylase RimI-like enzyme